MHPCWPCPSAGFVNAHPLPSCTATTRLPLPLHIATCPCPLVPQPQKYLSKNLPLPSPAVAWHPRYDLKFDAVGQIPPALGPAPSPGAPPSSGHGAQQQHAVQA